MINGLLRQEFKKAANLSTCQKKFILHQTLQKNNEKLLKLSLICLTSNIYAVLKALADNICHLS